VLEMKLTEKMITFWGGMVIILIAVSLLVFVLTTQTDVNGVAIPVTKKITGITYSTVLLLGGLLMTMEISRHK
jgi:hypothetical protein